MDPNSQPQQQQGPAVSTAPQPIDPYYGNGEGGGSIVKKIIITIIVLIVLVLVIAGGVIVLRKLTTPDKPKDVTLTYWGLWDDATIMAPIIDDFERANPHIKIQYEKQDIKGLGQYVDRLATRINNGSGPDIIRFHSSWTLQLKRYLLPFPKSVVDFTKLDEDYYKTVQRDMKLDGAYYGIPLGIDTLAMYVNTQLLQSKGLAVPQYWNDIYIKYAPELVVKDQSGKIITPSISLGTYDNIAHAPDIVALLLLQNGVDIKDLSGQSRSNAIDAFKYYTAFAYGDKAVWDQTLDNSTLAFAKGNLPIYFGYSWDIFTIKGLSPNLEFQVVKVPMLSKRNNTVSSYWAEGVSRKTKNSKEAFEFIEYLSKPETLQKLYQVQSKVRLFGTLYPRRSMAPLLSSNGLIYPFVSQADDAQSTFFSADTYDGDNGLVSQMNVYMGNAIRSINNNTSPDSAVDTLSKGVAQVLSRY